MAPQLQVEFVIFKIIYLPFLPPNSPKISLTRNRRCVLHWPRRSLHEVRSWFESVIYKEKSKISPHLKVRFCIWNIKSGNANLFVAKGYHYDKIVVLFGENRLYYLFYSDRPIFRRIKGWMHLTFSYCGCCLHTHYLKILEKIKEQM